MSPHQIRGQFAPCQRDPVAHVQSIRPEPLTCPSVHDMLPSMRRQGPIGHIDADCYYVSAERVRDDYLHGVPVGVLGNQGACIIAKSYEMKSCGVGTGMP